MNIFPYDKSHVIQWAFLVFIQTQLFLSEYPKTLRTVLAKYTTMCIM